MAGLTTTGLEIKRFDEIQSEVQAALDSKNTNIVIDSTSDSAAKNLANPLILSYAELWEFGEQVYNSFNIYKAEGYALDQLVLFKNLTRIQPSSSSGFIELFCTQQLGVTTNTQFRDNKNRLVISTQNKTMGQGTFRSINITVDNVIDSTNYYVVINNLEFSYVSGIGDTPQIILDGIRDDINLGSIATASTTTDNLFVEIVAPNAASFILFAELLSGDFSDTIIAASPTEGAIVFPLDTITELVDVISGVTSVNNPADFTIGIDGETDEELRTRYLNTSGAFGNATINSIINDVGLVEGVTGVALINNPLDIISVEGLPPHSFEVVVEGGDDQDIGDSILATGAAGITPFGAVSVTSTDIGGSDHAISFSRPDNIYIFLKATYSTYDEEVFPTSGEATMIESLVAYGAALDSDEDVIPPRFNTSIYANVSGVGDLLIEAGYSTNPVAVVPDFGYAATTIPISFREISLFEASRVTIIEV
jgi:hypothetical protein